MNEKFEREVVVDEVQVVELFEVDRECKLRELKDRYVVELVVCFKDMLFEEV